MCIIRPDISGFIHGDALYTTTKGGSMVISRGDGCGGSAGARCRCGSACSSSANCLDDTTAAHTETFRLGYLAIGGRLTL